jgi:hypothetical protein
VYISIEVDEIVIADVLKSASEVPFANFGKSDASSGRSGGAMYDDAVERTKRSFFHDDLSFRFDKITVQR